MLVDDGGPLSIL